MTESNPTVGDQQTVEQKLAPLLDLLKAADGQTKAAIRNAISASGVVERAKPKTTNADARRIAYSAGEIIQPPGFVPKPSDALVDLLGMEAAMSVMAERHNASEDGNGVSDRCRTPPVRIHGRRADRIRVGSRTKLLGNQQIRPLEGNRGKRPTCQRSASSAT